MGRKKALDENLLTDSTYYILLALLKPLHGYGIMSLVSEISNGEVEIGAASLYTIIKKLTQAELIQLIEESGERRKVYKITDKGTTLLEKDIKRRERMLNVGLKLIKDSKGDN